MSNNTTSPALDVLILTDFHYINKADSKAKEARKTFLGPVLIRKALRRMRQDGVEPGLILVLGDNVNDGEVSGAKKDTLEIFEELENTGIPYIAIPGNHDGSIDRFAKIFQTEQTLYEFGGYGFLTFLDPYRDDDHTYRSNEGLALPIDARRSNPELPLIALQHSPLKPQIESSYPYHPDNCDKIIESYQNSGVILSLSGHYHKGQPPFKQDNITYYTATSTCEEPFAYTHLRLRGKDFEITRHPMKLDVPKIWDVHCHSNFAYCAEDVNHEDDARISLEFGLEGVVITEHAYHLYLPMQDAWRYEWQANPGIIKKCFADRSGRMDEYKKIATSYRAKNVLLGLEVDLTESGDLFLADEDRNGWDLFVGAVHHIQNTKEATQAKREKLFMRDTERLLNHPISVLAHPFRWFRRAKYPVPTHLFRDVARMLADANVACELNFHTNEPDPELFRECLECGTKIAFGSDSHNREELGDFLSHVRFIEQLGVKPDELDDVLFRPNRV